MESDVLFCNSHTPNFRILEDISSMSRDGYILGLLVFKWASSRRGFHAAEAQSDRSDDY
jgi:hypothetical protein